MCEHLCRGPSIFTLMYGPGTKDCLLAVITLSSSDVVPRYREGTSIMHEDGIKKAWGKFCLFFNFFLRGGDMLRHATSEDCLKRYLNICHMHYSAISLQFIIRFNEWNEAWTLRIGS